MYFVHQGQNPITSFGTFKEAAETKVPYSGYVEVVTSTFSQLQSVIN